jgi:hypothetical protein
VEWHDAKVDEIIVRPNDPSEIKFTHLAVYHEVSAEIFHIWSYRATLQIYSLSKLQLDGEGGRADYISDIVASDEGGAVTSGMLPIKEHVAVNTIEVIFGSGRTVGIACSHVQLVLHEPLRHVEDWEGPLISPQVDADPVQK